VTVGLACQSARPLFEVYARRLSWVQRGSDVLLVIDTRSGLNHRYPDKMSRERQSSTNTTISEWRYLGHLGTGKFDPKSNTTKSYEAEWDNGNVSSGYVTLDASWVFTKTKA
jgi:hypothetical protein